MKQFNTVEDLILENIIVLDASIENQQDINIDPSKVAIIGYNIGFTKGLNIELERVLIKTLIDIDVKDKDHQKIDIRGQFTIDFIYYVKSLNEYIQKNANDSNYEIDTSLASMLLSTAFSTTRGIIYTRCLGTILGNVIVPVVSVQKLLETSDTNLIKENIEITAH